MYGIAIKTDAGIFTAIAPTKKLLRQWMKEQPCTILAWRMRDTTGWCAGSDHDPWETFSHTNFSNPWIIWE